MRKTKLKIFILVTMFIVPGFCLAMMSSSTYRIDSDTINAGGTPSSSTNYATTGTVGEQAIGESDSANYGDKAGFWYAGGSPGGLSLSCNASDVYMMDYTLGDVNNYSKYLFSTSEKCTISVGSTVPWTLTMNSTNMTSARNNLSNANIFLATDGNVSSGDTITSPTTSVTEPAGPEYSLNATRTVVSGNAAGIFENQPTMKLTNLNGLYAEAITGTIVITLQ